MSMFDQGHDALREYWTQAALLGLGGAAIRWLRHRASPLSPRRFRGILLYFTAIKEYETATATAVYWKEQVELETKESQRWKARFEACQSELMSRGIPTTHDVLEPDSVAGSG